MADDLGLTVSIFADAEQFKQVMANVKETATNAMSGVKDAIGAAGLMAADYLKGAVAGAANAEQSTEHLKTLIENQGQSWDVASKKVNDFTNGIMKMSDFSAGDAKAALQTLTERGVKLNDALSSQTALTNLAAGGNMSLTAASNLLAQAYNGRYMQLERLGIVTKEQVKHGITFAQVTDAINKRFNHAAANELDTYNGQMKQMSNYMNSIKITIGSVLLPYFEEFAKILNTAAQSVANFAKEHKTLIAAILSVTAVFGTLIGGAGVLQKILGVFGLNLSQITGLLKSMLGPIGLVITAIGLLTAAYVNNFGGFKTFVDNTIGSVITKMKALYEAIQLAWSGKGNVGVLEKAFGKSSASIRVFMNAIIDSIKAVIMIIHGDLAGALSFASEWFDPGADEGAGKIVHTTMSVAMQIRTAIITVISFVKQHLPEIKATFNNVMQGIVTVWNTILKPAITIMISIIGSLVKWVIANLPAIETIFKNVFKGIDLIWTTVLKPVLSFLVAQIGVVIQWIKANLPLIMETFRAVFNFVWSIVSTIVAKIVDFWKAHGQTIITIVKNDLDIIKTVISTVIHVVLDIIQVVLNLITGHWGAAFRGLLDIVRSVFSGAISIVRSILNSIGAVFGDMVRTAVRWGSDLIGGIVSGIRNSVSRVTNAVRDVANTIKNFLHFSVPDEGPLTEYEKWMPDFMSGLADGIHKNKHVVTNALKGLTKDMNNSISLPPIGLSAAGAGNSGNSTVINFNGNYSFSKKSDIDYFMNKAAILTKRRKL